MITVIVTFQLPAPITAAQAQALFESTAPRYRGVEGLVRKYYVLAEDGATAGGVYLWRTRAQAEAMYTDEWRAFVRGKYGSEPSVGYFHTPVVVDNLAGQILTAG